MADPSRQADALLTDHFTYTPLSLIDDIINAVNAIIYQALDAIENGLLNVPAAQLGFKPLVSSNGASDNSLDPADAARDEIENGVHQLETLLESTVDKNFDKFEIYTLRNILTVPENLGRWIRLGHYEALHLPLPDSTPTPESILDLRRKVQATTRLKLALQNRHSQNGAIITQMQSMLYPTAQNTKTSNSQSLAFLTQTRTTSASSSQNPLTTQTQFATSQLPTLKKLVAELRPKLNKLKSKGLDDVDWDSKREERRQYIEGGVRRVVGKGGFGNGNAILEGLGERRGREEIEGLEAVVGDFGGGGERMEE